MRWGLPLSLSKERLTSYLISLLKAWCSIRLHYVIVISDKKRGTRLIKRWKNSNLRSERPVDISLLVDPDTVQKIEGKEDVVLVVAVTTAHRRLWTDLRTAVAHVLDMDERKVRVRFPDAEPWAGWPKDMRHAMSLVHRD